MRRGAAVLTETVVVVVAAVVGAIVVVILETRHGTFRFRHKTVVKLVHIVVVLAWLAIQLPRTESFVQLDHLRL